MDFSINIPYRRRVVFQVRVQKNHAPRKKLDPAKAAAREARHSSLEQEVNAGRDRLFFYR